MWVTKLLISPVKNRIFCSKTTKFSPKLAFLSIAGSFGALLVGWLVVVARGLYLARHLFTLWVIEVSQHKEVHDVQPRKKTYNVHSVLLHLGRTAHPLWLAWGSHLETTSLSIQQTFFSSYHYHFYHTYILVCLPLSSQRFWLPWSSHIKTLVVNIHIWYPIFSYS